MTIQDFKTGQPGLLSTFETAEHLSLPRQTLAGAVLVLAKVGCQGKPQSADLDVQVTVDTVTPKEFA